MNKKKIVFVAASITGGRSDLPYVKRIIDYFLQRGCFVPSLHNGADDPIKTYAGIVGGRDANDPRTYRIFDNFWIDKCRLLIVEASTPSHGVGGEVEHCRLKTRLGLPLTPILLLHRTGTEISPYMASPTQNESQYIWIRQYSNEEELLAILDEFLAAFPI